MECFSKLHVAKIHKRKKWNPTTDCYRDANNYIRVRTIVTAGFIDHYTAEELIFIQKNITDRINGNPILFTQDSDAHLLEYADQLYDKAVRPKR